MYKNQFSTGYQVLCKTGYCIDSHGCLSNTASYLITNDFPNYATMFYSPTEHEVITSIKYGNFDQDYSNTREIQQSLNGPPIEFYIPHSFIAEDGVGKQNEVQIVPEEIKKIRNKMQKEALNEIVKAQKEVKAKKIKIEFEETLIVRKRKRTIVLENK